MKESTIIPIFHASKNLIVTDTILDQLAEQFIQSDAIQAKYKTFDRWFQYESWRIEKNCLLHK